jgi:hypothetical protein
MTNFNDNKSQFESDFWGLCTNTLGEEIKQLVYAKRMGLNLHADWRSEFNINMLGSSVVDIGGGPTSLLLKCVNVNGMVVDPLSFPLWVYDRYKAAKILFLPKRGEDICDILSSNFDEAWIYNVLQHVDDPIQVIENARHIAKRVRLFEWIDIPAYPGHPHSLTKDMLEFALGNSGNTEVLNESGCNGKAFYGVWNK